MYGGGGAAWDWPPRTPQNFCRPFSSIATPSVEQIRPVAHLKVGFTLTNNMSRLLKKLFTAIRVGRERGDRGRSLFYEFLVLVHTTAQFFQLVPG